MSDYSIRFDESNRVADLKRTVTGMEVENFKTFSRWEQLPDTSVTVVFLYRK